MNSVLAIHACLCVRVYHVHCTCVYICMCICVCACVYVYMCVCVYVYVLWKIQYVLLHNVYLIHIDLALYKAHYVIPYTS